MKGSMNGEGGGGGSMNGGEGGWFLYRGILVCYGVLPSQIEDHSQQSFYAKALMDRECPYDATALSFKVVIK